MEVLVLEFACAICVVVALDVKRNSTRVYQEHGFTSAVRSVARAFCRAKAGSHPISTGEDIEILVLEFACAVFVVVALDK